MKGLFCLAAFAVIVCAVESKTSSPLVKVYSQKPGKFGDKNTLICHVSQFQPPNINIELHKNGVKIPDTNVTDLAFQDSWQFHLTTTAAFTPQAGVEYHCVVTHQGKMQKYTWESNM